MIDPDIPANGSQTEKPQEPRVKPNGHDTTAECAWCSRTKAGGCICIEKDKVLAKSNGRKSGLTPEGELKDAAYAQRIAALEAEMKEMEAGDEENRIVITCVKCGAAEKVAGNEPMAAQKLCLKCYTQEALAHREPPVECLGGCGKRFAKVLLNAQQKCEACGQPAEENSRIIVQKEIGEKLTSLRGHWASTVAPVPVRWIWEQRFPAGKLGLLNGPQGSGKSMVFIDIAARVSTGSDWPDGAKTRWGPRRSS